jgi:hypothetical protein
MLPVYMFVVPYPSGEKRSGRRVPETAGRAMPEFAHSFSSAARTINGDIKVVTIAMMTTAENR